MSELHKKNISFKDANLIEKVSCLVWMGVQIVLCALFLIGFVNLNGERVSVVTFLNCILEIFSTHWTMFYQYASICAQGVLYVTILVFMIKNIVQSISYFFSPEHRRVGLEECCKKACKYLIEYLLLSFAFNRVRFSDTTMFALIFIAIVYVAMEGVKLYCYDRKPSVFHTASRVLNAVIICVILSIFGAIIHTNSLETTWNGFIHILAYANGGTGENIVQGIYFGIVKNIFLFIIMCQFIGILEEATYEKNPCFFRGWKGLATSVISFACVDLIVYFTVIGDITSQSNAISAAYGYLANNNLIVFMLLPISGLLTNSYPVVKWNDTIKSFLAKEEEKEEEEEQSLTPVTPVPVVEPQKTTMDTPVAQPQQQPMVTVQFVQPMTPVVMAQPTQQPVMQVVEVPNVQPVASVPAEQPVAQPIAQQPVAQPTVAEEAAPAEQPAQETTENQE